MKFIEETKKESLLGTKEKRKARSIDLAFVFSSVVCLLDKTNDLVRHKHFSSEK